MDFLVARPTGGGLYFLIETPRGDDIEQSWTSNPMNATRFTRGQAQAECRFYADRHVVQA